MSKTTAIIELMRPANSLMVGFAVLVGAVVVHPNSLLGVFPLMGFLTGFFISSYSMVVNDRYDVEVDRINAPQRPLPSGKLTEGEAVRLEFILLAVGLSTALLTSLVNFMIAIIFAAVGWLYSTRGKKYGLLGNSMVASSLAIPYIYGGVAVGGATNLLLWLLASTSFSAGMGREVIKTISDIYGDEIRNIASIARVRGRHTASKIGVVFLASAIGLAWIPYVVGIVGFPYALLILIPDTILVFASIRILRNQSKEVALKVKNIILLGMMFGLVAFVVGASASF